MPRGLQNNGFIKPAVVLTTLCSFWLPAHALEIYKWTDELGQSHMADVVPEKYRATAKPLNYRKDNVTDAERQDAEAKAAKTKSLLAPKQSAVVAQPAVLSSSKPAEQVQGPSCSQKWDEFYSSQDCFAPYSVPSKWGVHFKPEAFSKCQEVKMPVKDCGYDKRLPPRQ